MKIIFVNRYFHPDHAATSQMLTGVATGLAREGLEIEVVTSRLRYDGPAEPLAAREKVQGVRVHRVWTTRFGRTTLLGRAFDYATFYLSAAFAVARSARGGDIVVAKTDPPMLSVPLALVVRLRRAQLVNWLQDIFPEIAEELEIGKRGAAARALGLLRRLRDASLHSARFNVVLGKLMADRVEALGVPSAQIRVITNWADGSLIRPVPHGDNETRRAWGLDDKFVVGYSGNLGRAHDVDTMLEAIEITESAAPKLERPVTWLFVGGGARSAGLQREVEARRLTSVLLKPYQPQEKLAQSLSSADIHLVSLRPELEGLIVPSKLYGIAAAGRATIFIGSPGGEIAQWLAAAEAGLTVEQGNGRALAAAILDLASDQKRILRMGWSARVAFERGHDLPIVVAAWRQLLAEIEHDRANR